MSKHKSLEVINGELLVFGEKLPRHPEFPWLFSATHLHKFCGPTLRRIAEREGKDPDKVFAARRPGQWLQKNILNNEAAVAQYAKFISENTEVKAMFEAHFEQERRKARSR